MRTVRIVGGGRAGLSFAAALDEIGWSVDAVADRSTDIGEFADGVDLVLITVPDDDVEAVAAAIRPGPAVVAHVAGSLGLDAVARHPRHGSVHPLMALPDAEIGRVRLMAGGWFAVDGDGLLTLLVEALGGRAFRVAGEQRALYHAAAAVAANHLVALLGQVERLADQAGVPFEAYLDLARGALDAVAFAGPRAALTGPAARGDEATIERHLNALPASERATYVAMVEEARRLAR